jgi:uncharacterized protein YaaW (UPF0174 family)
MLSLKTGSKKIDYKISCLLELNDANYKLVISEMNTNTENTLKKKTTLFEIENEYKSLLMSDSVNKILKTISNHLIKEIKRED